MNFIARQKRILALLNDLRLDALLVTHLPNIRYLCGFTGSAAMLLATRTGCVFFTDGRYRQQASAEVQGARIVVPRGSALHAAAGLITRMRKARVAVEADHVTLATYAAIKGALPKDIRLVEVRGLVEQLRMLKDTEEVRLIREAVLLGAKLLKPAIRAIAPGVAESAVAAKIEYAARRGGAQSMSFETIVASGKRSALPHGVASTQPIPAKGFVVLDFGVILHGYCSDMTRTVHVGKVGSDRRRLYEAVLEAQKAAIVAVAPGIAVGEVDHAARSVLRKARLHRYFTHSTGHGVGLEIHEMPRIARGQPDLLQPGMVITIEPGVYVPGLGGVRIEDMVVVTERGCEVLTPASKELIEL